MHENIVVGIDGSDSSRAAMIEASNWVKNHGGKIILVHAVYFDEEEFGNAPEQLEKRIEIGKQMCLQGKEMIGREFKIEAESLVCEGEPPDVIVNIAREKKADLITMGTYGRKGLKRLILGSVTSGVVSNSPCDVLVVKKPCSECTGSYKSVLVSFDGSESSRKAVERACEYAKIDGAQVTVLYVIPRYEEMIGFLRTESIRKSMQQEASKIVDSAMQIASARGVVPERVIEEGHAADRVVEFASKSGKDLIVMGSHGWRGVSKALMGSTAERVITHSSIPVLVAR
jgi:nucleotide-binding universal stress UspA family protein